MAKKQSSKAKAVQAANPNTGGIVCPVDPMVDPVGYANWVIEQAEELELHMIQSAEREREIDTLVSSLKKDVDEIAGEIEELDVQFLLKQAALEAKRNTLLVHGRGDIVDNALKALKANLKIEKGKRDEIRQLKEAEIRQLLAERDLLAFTPEQRRLAEQALEAREAQEATRKFKEADENRKKLAEHHQQQADFLAVAKREIGEEYRLRIGITRKLEAGETVLPLPENPTPKQMSQYLLWSQMADAWANKKPEQTVSSVTQAVVVRLMAEKHNLDESTERQLSRWLRDDLKARYRQKMGLPADDKAAAAKLPVRELKPRAPRLQWAIKDTGVDYSALQDLIEECLLKSGLPGEMQVTRVIEAKGQPARISVKYAGTGRATPIKLLGAEGISASTIIDQFKNLA